MISEKSYCAYADTHHERPDTESGIRRFWPLVWQFSVRHEARRVRARENFASQGSGICPYLREFLRICHWIRSSSKFHNSLKNCRCDVWGTKGYRKKHEFLRPLRRFKKKHQKNMLNGQKPPNGQKISGKRVFDNGKNGILVT